MLAKHIHRCKNYIFLVISIFSLSGCFPTYSWYKPDATMRSRAADMSQCDMDSARAYPVLEKFVITEQGFKSGGQSTCRPSGDQLVCQSEPDYITDPKGYTVDRNADARDNAFKNCMVGKGWVLKRDDDQYTQQQDRRSNSQPEVSLADEGGVCVATTQCSGSLSCISGKCSSRSGATKERDYSNKRGLPERSSCNRSIDCSGSLMCDSGVCVRQSLNNTNRKAGVNGRSVGSVCSTSNECLGVLVCESGKCTNSRR